jgi:hypothetical protein
MRRLAILFALLLLPVSALAEPAADGTCDCTLDAAGTLVHDVNAIPAPTLDLATLGDRLRNTHAIGLFGKLALKSRVDALLEQAKSADTADARAALRPDFDALMADVVKQLDRGGDAALARDVTRSADSLWKLLVAPRPS